MSIININDESFAEEVEKGNGVVLVDFWAPWCVPCKRLSPILEDIDKDLNDTIKIAKINADDNPQSANRFGIMSIPSLIIFKDGIPIDKIVGLQPKEDIKSRLQKHI
jgi:thioredoxin 1